MLRFFKLLGNTSGNVAEVTTSNALKVDAGAATISSFSYDAGGRTRVSQGTTLIDGKILGIDDTFTFQNVGTGTFAYSNNTVLMSVTAGQYCIRQTKRFYPYFSGKSQLVEETFEDFQLQAGVIKRVGYFSSNTVAPYDSNKDGFWLESNGDDNKFYVRSSRNGTLTVDTDVSAYFLTYNGENFTVTANDFLWLGGAALRTFIKNTDGFDTVNMMDFAGQQKGTFMLSPNQPVRYEIRSTTGIGQFRYVCCQVSTEGSINESGKPLALINYTAIACNTVNTIYALKSIKKQATYRDTAILIVNVAVGITATTDAGVVMLIINPTLSAPIVYANNGKVQNGTATNQTITAGTGRVISAFPISASGADSSMKDSYYGFLSGLIDNTFDEYVLAYMPTTNNQNVNGIISIKEI